MANPPAAARYGKQPAAAGSGKPSSGGSQEAGSPAAKPHPQDIAAGGGSRCARVLVMSAWVLVES